MNHNITQIQEQSAILHQIRSGMTVYDSERNDIGSVDTVYFGAVNADSTVAADVPATATRPDAAIRNSFVGDLVEVFDSRDQVPEELAERLRYHGYIRIDGGWFGSNRYIMPEQIEAVSDEGVYLRTGRDQLIKE